MDYDPAATVDAQGRKLAQYHHPGQVYQNSNAAAAEVANAAAQERAKKNGNIVTAGRQIPFGPSLYPTDRVLLAIGIFALCANSLWLTLAGGAGKLVASGAEDALVTLKRMSYISLLAVFFVVFSARQCIFA